MEREKEKERGGERKKEGERDSASSKYSETISG